MDKLLEIISEIDIPSAYDHFGENESPSPPFITYLLPGSDNFSADGRVYFRISEIHIELYTDEKDFALEKTVETLLNANELVFRKEQTYLDSERMHETIYTTEVILEV